MTLKEFIEEKCQIKDSVYRYFSIFLSDYYDWKVWEMNVNPVYEGEYAEWMNRTIDEQYKKMGNPDDITVSVKLPPLPDGITVMWELTGVVYKEVEGELFPQKVDLNKKIRIKSKTE